MAAVRSHCRKAAPQAAVPRENAVPNDSVSSELCMADISAAGGRERRILS